MLVRVANRGTVRPMRLALAIVGFALGGCGFDLPLGGTQTDGGPGSDAREIDAAMIDAPLGPPVACSAPSAAGLLACFELEDNVTDGTLRDSSPAHVDATTTGLEAFQRTKPATSEAANVTGAVSTYVPDSPSLDLATGYTVTMWIRPTDVPSASRAYGLFDHELQYAGAIGKAATGSAAQLRCINTGRQYEFTDSIPMDTWSFIACTWDGTTLCAQYWSSTTDHQRFCTMPSGIAADGDHGMAIGHLSNGGQPESPFVGSFDSVQVYDRELSDAELCSIIGEPASCLPCNAGC